MTCTRLVLAIGAAVALATTACTQTIDDGEPATQAQCRAVEGHVADLQLGTVPGHYRVHNPEMLAHRQNLVRTDELFVDQCMSHRSAAYARCALASTTLDEYRGCDLGERTN